MTTRITREQRASIGLTLYLWLREHSITEEQFAIMVSLSADDIRNICKGNWSGNIVSYMKLAKAMGIQDYELTGIKDVTPYLDVSITTWKTIAEKVSDLLDGSLPELLDSLDSIYDNIDEGYVEGNVGDVETYQLQLKSFQVYLESMQDDLLDKIEQLESLDGNHNTGEAE